MLKASDIRSYYSRSLTNAAKYYHKHGNSDSLYNYFQGVVHGYGDVLGYEFEQIESDVKAAIEQYQPGEATA